MPPLILQNGLPITLAYSDALFPRVPAVGDETKISHPYSVSDSLPWRIKRKTSAEEQGEKERDSLHRLFAIDGRTEDVRKHWEKLKVANESQEWGENKGGKYKGAKGGEEASHAFLPAIFFCHSKLFDLVL